MIPYQEASLRQNWELISFIPMQNPESYKAISTAYVFPPVPFETFLPTSAQKVPEELKVEGLETYIFKNNEPGNRGVDAGKTSVMTGGCYDHFEEIYRAVIRKPNADLERELRKESDVNSALEIATFVYKPAYNGWVVATTKMSKTKYQTSLHPSANKADPTREVMGQETLFYDSSTSTDVICSSGFTEALKKHFDSVIKEVDHNSGYFSGMQRLKFDENRLRQLLSLG